MCPTSYYVSHIILCVSHAILCVPHTICASHHIICPTPYYVPHTILYVSHTILYKPHTILCVPHTVCASHHIVCVPHHIMCAPTPYSCCCQQKAERTKPSSIYKTYASSENWSLGGMEWNGTVLRAWRRDVTSGHGYQLCSNGVLPTCAVFQMKSCWFASSSLLTPQGHPAVPRLTVSIAVVILCRLHFEIWWHTVTHGRGSEGETGECSG